MKTLTVRPAYGRNYRSKAAILADWKTQKDFDLSPMSGRMGPYVNIDDCPNDVDKVEVRYDQGRSATVAVLYRNAEGWGVY